jgi:hypothetical protein
MGPKPDGLHGVQNLAHHRCESGKRECFCSRADDGALAASP